MVQIEHFLNKVGKIKAWPSKQEAKLAVLWFLGNKFETGRFYTEKEVNSIIEANHAFGDYFLLRRGMVDCGALRRTANGARYWRGGLWPQGQETERLVLSEATEEDGAELGEIYRACAYMSQWTGMEHDDESLTALLAGADLPPEGSPEFSHLAVLRLKDGRAVGLAQYYTAYPGPGSMWLGLMLLHPDYQHAGYGTEFIAAFLDECRRQGYRRAGLGVALLNQPALKFWVKSGFDHIDRVKADGESGAGVKGMLALSMQLG